MGIISDFFSGAAKSVLNPAAPGPASGIDPILGLCDSCNWPIDERDDDSIELHFKDPVFRVREMLITASSKTELVVFTVFSHARFPVDEVPAKLAYHLLDRNSNALFHSWRVMERGDTVGFAAWASTFSSHLKPTLFQTLVMDMVKDASELDAMLHKADLI